jgi:hypothetical protein
MQKDIILHDNDADLVVLNPDWDSLLDTLKKRLPGFRVFFVVPSEDTSIKWIRVMSGVGIMDLVRGRGEVLRGRGRCLTAAWSMWSHLETSATSGSAA